jgi:hypothetical protein
MNRRGDGILIVVVRIGGVRIAEVQRCCSRRGDELLNAPCAGARQTVTDEEQLAELRAQRREGGLEAGAVGEIESAWCCRRLTGRGEKDAGDELRTRPVIDTR